MVGEIEAQRQDFFVALARMEEEAIALRREELRTKMDKGALDSAEKAELRELLAARVRPPAASA